MENNLKYTLGFVVICIFALSFVMAGMIKSNSQCINEPFVYAAKTIVDNRGEVAGASCSCQLHDGGDFYFDSEGMYADNPMSFAQVP